MSLRLKIAANTLVQILGKVISAGCTFLITILVAKRFGVVGFGEFVKITTYVSLFYLIVDFGLNAVALQEYQKLKIKSQKYISKIKKEEFSSQASFGQQNAKIIFLNLLGLRTVFAIILIFLSLAILTFLPFNPLTLKGFTPLSKLGIIILVPTILTQAIFTSCNAIFQKNLRYDLSVLASSLGGLVTLGLIYLLLKIKASLLLLIASYLIGGIVMAVLALYFSKLLFTNYQGFALLKNPIIQGVPLTSLKNTSELTKAQNFNQFQVLLSLWHKLFIKSLPLGLTLIFNLIYFKADALILTVFRPTEEVGIYGLAKSFFEFPLSVPTFFMNSMYPILLKRTKEQKNKRTKRLVKKSIALLLISSLLLVIMCYLLAPYIVLIKKDFAPSKLCFQILSLFTPVFFLSSLFMWTLIAFGKQKLLALVYGNAMIISLLLNLFFIPRYGYLAAAIILGLSELIVLGLTGGFCWSFLKEK